MADSGHKNPGPASTRNEYLKTRRKENRARSGGVKGRTTKTTVIAKKKKKRKRKTKKSQFP